MSGTTPGQAAYAAWWATAEGVPATPDVTYDQDAEAWEAAAKAGSEKLRAELAEVNGYHGELLDEVLRNAGDEFDTDDAADVIAVRYVRHLEQRGAGGDGMSGKRAYEAYISQSGEKSLPCWDALPRELKEAWEAAANAAVAAVVDPTAQDYDNAAEILDHLDTAGITVDGELRAAWSERAGLKPVIVGAGVEYLIDPGDPGAWQKVADMPAREGRVSSPEPDGPDCASSNDGEHTMSWWAGGTCAACGEDSLQDFDDEDPF